MQRRSTHARHERDPEARTHELEVVLGTTIDSCTMRGAFETPSNSRRSHCRRIVESKVAIHSSSARSVGVSSVRSARAWSRRRITSATSVNSGVSTRGSGIASATPPQRCTDAEVTLTRCDERDGLPRLALAERHPQLGMPHRAGAGARRSEDAAHRGRERTDAHLTGDPALGAADATAAAGEVQVGLDALQVGEHGRRRGHEVTPGIRRARRRGPPVRAARCGCRVRGA